MVPEKSARPSAGGQVWSTRGWGFRRVRKPSFISVLRRACKIAVRGLLFALDGFMTRIAPPGRGPVDPLDNRLEEVAAIWRERSSRKASVGYPVRGMPAGLPPRNVGIIFGLKTDRLVVSGQEDLERQQCKRGLEGT